MVERLRVLGQEESRRNGNGGGIIGLYSVAMKQKIN